eukprot:TRINITY_DN7181_c0_g1_i1.p1 TRINITY_DN7181_c0_g1~~TRINITY_DN7181_c0_g1_i1.p1  ORF type:complete len:160 (-),score=46.95 TRINITY_DN7181_c0_g1_i1:127-606(-)
MEVFNNVNLIWQFVSELCTAESCPAMTAGPNYSFLWRDKGKYPKPTSLPAVTYIELLLAWTSDRLDDETIFPISGKFPKEFSSTVKDIWKRLARVFFHIYYHHWNTIQAVKAEAHINTCFKHFIYFSREFALISQEDLAPMASITSKIKWNEDSRTFSE